MNWTNLLNATKGAVGKLSRGNNTAASNQNPSNEPAEQSQPSGSGFIPKRNQGNVNRWNQENQNKDGNYGGRVPYTSQKEVPQQNQPEPVQSQAEQNPSPQRNQHFQQKPNDAPAAGQSDKHQAENTPIAAYCGVMAVMNFEQCGCIIEQMRDNKEMYITLEGITDSELVTRCIYALTGAAFAMQAGFYRISLKLPIFLITTRIIQYYIDPAFVQNFQQVMAQQGNIQPIDVLQRSVQPMMYANMPQNQYPQQGQFYGYAQVQPMMQGYSAQMQPMMQGYPSQMQPAMQGYAQQVPMQSYAQTPSGMNGYPPQTPVQSYVPQEQMNTQGYSVQSQPVQNTTAYPKVSRVQVHPSQSEKQNSYDASYRTDSMGMPGAKTGQFIRNANQPQNVADIVNGIRGMQ